MYIIFHCKKLNLLAYYSVLLYINDKHKNKNKNNINQYFYRLKDMEKKYKNKKMGELIFIQKDKYDNYIYLLERGKKYNISIQALLGYNRIFFTKNRYVFFNLDDYQNIYFKIESISEKINLSFLKKNLFIKGIKKCEQEFINDLILLKNRMIHK